MEVGRRLRPGDVVVAESSSRRCSGSRVDPQLRGQAPLPERHHRRARGGHGDPGHRLLGRAHRYPRMAQAPHPVSTCPTTASGPTTPTSSRIDDSAKSEDAPRTRPSCLPGHWRVVKRSGRVTREPSSATTLSTRPFASRGRFLSGRPGARQAYRGKERTHDRRPTLEPDVITVINLLRSHLIDRRHATFAHASPTRDGTAMSEC
jgi:hypothetical protein